MLAVAETITAVEPETASQTPVTTTLYDLIAALNDQVEPWEADIVTDAVVNLCNGGRVRFLDMPPDCKVVCA